MTTGIDLINELKSKGGILGILKEFIKKIESFGKKATEIWRKAFPESKVTITHREIGRYWGLMKGIYARAKGARKRTIGKYLKEYEKLYNEYKRTIDDLNLHEIEKLIQEGERVYNSPKINYRLFLYNLHEWIAKVYVYFVPRKNKAANSIPDLYKFIDKMILTIIDISSEYRRPPPPGHFEFVLSCFLHVENFIHLAPEYYEPIGNIPVAIGYCLDLMEELARMVDYHIVYPTEHEGDWEDLYYIEPLMSSTDLHGDKLSREYIQKTAAQIGLDIRNNISTLEYLNQLFPSNFIVYDHLRGIERRSLFAMLPWDFPKLPVDIVAGMYKLYEELTR